MLGLRTLRCLVALATMLVLSLVTGAEAAVVWPSSGQWKTIKDSSGAHIQDSDGPGGGGDARNDIRGDATYSAGFVVWDDTPGNDNLLFRMRLEADPNSNLNRVWQVLIDSDSDTGVDWVLQLDGKTDNQVELVATTTEGSRYQDVRISTTVTWSDSTGTYWQTLAVDDGSTFGSGDYFLDIAIPRSTFQSATSTSNSTAFRVALTTSDRHDQIKKDFPGSLGKGANVSTGWSGAFSADDVRVPEPGTWALFGLGALILAGRVRKRRSATERARS